MPSGRQLGIRRWRHAINHPPAWLTTIFIWDWCRAPSSVSGRDRADRHQCDTINGADDARLVACAETAEHREPYESRGSRADLGAPGDESPLATRHFLPVPESDLTESTAPIPSVRQAIMEPLRHPTPLRTELSVDTTRRPLAKTHGNSAAPPPNGCCVSFSRPLASVRLPA